MTTPVILFSQLLLVDGGMSWELSTINSNFSVGTMPGLLDLTGLFYRSIYSVHWSAGVRRAGQGWSGLFHCFELTSPDIHPRPGPLDSSKTEVAVLDKCRSWKTVRTSEERSKPAWAKRHLEDEDVYLTQPFLGTRSALVCFVHSFLQILWIFDDLCTTTNTYNLFDNCNN